MVKKSKWPILLAGSLLVLLVGLMTTIVLAQTAMPEAGAATEDESTTGRGLRLHGGFGRHGGFGHFGGGRNEENLAEELGIAVEELQAARDRAYAASVAEAVADGRITQEQADDLLARHALKATIDQKVLMAEALGVTVEELETTLADGTLADLMAKKGIDAATLRTNMQAAYEAAVARAVADGVITQAQADEVLSGNMGFHLFGGRGHHHGHGRSVPDAGESDDSESTTQDTGFDA